MAKIIDVERKKNNKIVINSSIPKYTEKITKQKLICNTKNKRETK